MDRVLCVLIGYIFGLFQTSYLYGRIKGIDIREHGSGNAGATNALRTLGFKAGIIAFIGDCLKCVLAVLLVRALFAGRYPGEDMGIVLGLYAAAGVILGHNFPCYLHFHGGKGISATAGLFFSLDPLLTLVGAILFFGVVGVTRFVSLGSILVSVWLSVGVIWSGMSGRWVLSSGHTIELYVVVLFISIMNIARHHANIKRLLTGTESKLGSHAK